MAFGKVVPSAEGIFTMGATRQDRREILETLSLEDLTSLGLEAAGEITIALEAAQEAQDRAELMAELVRDCTEVRWSDVRDVENLHSPEFHGC